MANIRLYSTGCPKCNVLKKKLDALNAKYDVITGMDEIKGICEATQNDSLPILQVDEAWGTTTYDFARAIDWIKKVGESRNDN